MLFISISKPQSIQYLQYKSFAIELRLDLFPLIDIEYIKNFLRNALSPVMLTLRKRSQGGNFQGSETEREALIEQLLALEPPFFDLEYEMNPTFLHSVIKRYSKTKFILSCHYFQKTPSDLEGIYHAMQAYPVFSYKIALMTYSTNDALKMLLFIKKHPKVSVVCMGERGAFARVLGVIAGNLMNYACFNAAEQTGPGQLTVSELVDVYHYPSLNQETAIYGLIGDPIEKSRGHLYHNAIFQQRGLNAVYVKMIVQPKELPEFLSLSRAMGIRGLSVTIPLKEKIIPLLDEIDPSAVNIGAINTIRYLYTNSLKTGEFDQEAFQNFDRKSMSLKTNSLGCLYMHRQLIGTNTDGLGALDAIEKKMDVRGKKMVLIGAGGAARAIAYEAKVRGADLLILNRTVQRAQNLAIEIECEAGGLDQIPSLYDILINCSSDPMPIDPKKIRPKTLVMDIVYFPKETAFLEEASLKKCQIVYGEEMFLNQAARQTDFWIGL